MHPELATISFELENSSRSYFDESVMPPSPLTKLLYEHMTINEGEVVIDAGSGCGALALGAAYRGADIVYAIELNLQGVAVTHDLACRHGLRNRILPILGDMRTIDQMLLPEIDAIICNPPQLPKVASTAGAYAAGSNGRLFVDYIIHAAARIFTKASYGSKRLELVTTSVVGIDKTFMELRRAGFDYTVMAQATAEFRPAYYPVRSAIDTDWYEWDGAR